MKVRDRAAMCETCIWAERDGVGVVGCTVGGRKLVDYLTVSPCPKGKHGPGQATSGWLWMSWMGVPYPLRVLLWVVHPKHPKPGSFVACGCNVWAKSLWNRLVLKVKGAAHANPVQRPSLR